MCFFLFFFFFKRRSRSFNNTRSSADPKLSVFFGKRETLHVPEGNGAPILNLFLCLQARGGLFAVEPRKPALLGRGGGARRRAKPASGISDPTTGSAICISYKDGNSVVSRWVTIFEIEMGPQHSSRASCGFPEHGKDIVQSLRHRVNHSQTPCQLQTPKDYSKP